jgi:PhzF family phenazine biosynthesis protein
MAHKLFQVDAFTEVPFKGNPAAVCLLSGPEPSTWMQSLAMEMNLSETAFLLPEEQGWRLRWFTPTTEVRLCGHATLASAVVLFTTRPELQGGSLRFNTLSGELQARWLAGQVALDFPIMEPEPAAISPEVEKALGISLQTAVHSGDYYLFEAVDAAAVRSLTPDFYALAQCPTPEVIVTARSDGPDFDFISRFFAPQLGINEDPVTGSAHCLLAPFWAEKLQKNSFRAFQASARGGVLRVQVQGERVELIGGASFIFKGDLLV